MQHQYSSNNPTVMQDAMKYLFDKTGLSGCMSQINALGRIIFGIGKSSKGRPSNVSMDDFSKFFGRHFDSVPKDVLTNIQTLIDAANEGRLKSKVGRNEILYIRDGMEKQFSKDNLECESIGDYEGRSANAYTEAFIKGAIGIAAEQADDIPLAIIESAMASKCQGIGESCTKTPTYIHHATIKADSANGKQLNRLRHAVTNYVKAVAISDYLAKKVDKPDITGGSYGLNNYKRLHEIFVTKYEETFGRRPEKDRITSDRVKGWIKEYEDNPVEMARKLNLASFGG